MASIAIHGIKGCSFPVDIIRNVYSLSFHRFPLLSFLIYLSAKVCTISVFGLFRTELLNT